MRLWNPYLSTGGLTQATRILTIARLLLAGALALLVPGLVEAQPTTTRVSVGPGGVQGNDSSHDSAISADGRWVAFASAASNLVAGDTNDRRDVFVHDQQTATTTRVSVGPGGAQANQHSYHSALNADGRWVAFWSNASNLVAGDTNGAADVFVHDRQTGTTTRVSVGPDGAQGNGNSTSHHLAIGPNGNWVAFLSLASNLVAGDTNGSGDVFVHDRQTATTTRASVGSGGVQANAISLEGFAISPDGRWVAFASGASNLVAGDTNGRTDVFVHDRQTATTTRVSVGPGGAQANQPSGWNLALSADGRWVAFASSASNLVADDTNGRTDVFVHDRQTATTTRVSVGPGGAQANDDSFPSALSADGRWVAFESNASNLVAGDGNGRTDVFVHDRQTATTTRVSVGPGGAQANDLSWNSAMSADGHWVTFSSFASNLVAGDTNGREDVFVYDSGNAGCAVTHAPTSVSTPTTGATGTVTVLASVACEWTAVSNDPSWLTVTAGSSGTGSGTVSYSVAVNAGEPRTGTLTIASQTFTVHQASGPTPPPTTVPDGYGTWFATPLVVAAPGVLANDVTYGGGAMTAALVTGAGNGAVTLNANGGFSYTPDPRFSGADTFTYRAVNAAGPGNAAAVTVTVVPPRPTTTRVGLYTTYRAPAISADDRWVAFASGDTNGRTDVFVYDRQTATTTLASVGPGGVGGNGFSDEAAISADGRSVAFSSSASNLVAGDTNGSKDVFVRDRQAAATTRVSVGTGGTQGNNASYSPAISADGRWVAFASSASNLVAGDLNNVDDVFVHDRQTGTTTPVSVGPAGAQALSASRSPAISADGRWVAFDSGASNLVAGDTNGADDVFVHDRQTGATTRVSVGPGGAQANAGSYDAALSADGRWVAFVSYASNLVAGDTNGARDVFVHDQQTGATTHVSMGTYLSISPAISADGRWVAFARERHFPTQLNVWLHDRQTGETTVVAAGSLPRPFIDLGPSSGSPAISADGGWVAFVSMASDLVPDDTNDATDVFVYGRDRGCAVTLAPTFASAPAAGATGGVSVLASAGCGWTAVSDDPGWLIVTDDASGTGSAAIKYHVTANAGVPRTGTVTIAGQTFTVTQLAPPTTVPDTYATTFNTPLVITAPGVLANDRPNNGGAMSATLVDPPANGTVALDPSGAFTYTPTFGFSGADAFSYRALTSSGSGNVAAVSITVAAAMGPLPPVGLVAHSVFGNIVTLRWTNPSVGPAPTNFVLEGGVNPGEALASVPTGSVVPTFTFTAPTGSFYVRVYALSGAFRSAASNDIRIHVNVPVAPSAPAHLLGQVDGSALALAWTNTYGGGEPTSLVLDVTGSIVTSLPLAFGDAVSFADVPAGTYTLALRAENAGGISPPSNAVTLAIPGPCSGPPLVPSNVLAYRVGRIVFVDWAPATSGPAPTGYLLDVTGTAIASFETSERALTGTVGPGSYTLRVVAVNACGASAGTPPQTVVVP